MRIWGNTTTQVGTAIAQDRNKKVNFWTPMGTNLEIH